MEPAAAAGPGKASRHMVTADFHAAAAAASPVLPGETTPSSTTKASRWWSSVAATAASLVAVGLGGGALLVWWALAFHPANARLWMVPAGLVLLGTPALAWLSLCASAAGPCGAVHDEPARV